MAYEDESVNEELTLRSLSNDSALGDGYHNSIINTSESEGAGDDADGETDDETSYKPSSSSESGDSEVELSPVTVKKRCFSKDRVRENAVVSGKESPLHPINSANINHDLSSGKEVPMKAIEIGRNEKEKSVSIASTAKKVESNKKSGEAPSPEVSKITVKCSNTRNGKRAWDKRHYCLYCKQKKAKMARHMQEMHGNEDQVKRLGLLLPAKNANAEEKKKTKKAREEGWRRLRKLGDYNHNYYVLQEGIGELVVERCPVTQTSYKMFLPCHVCYGFYYRKDLHRHLKMCEASDEKEKSSTSRRVQSRAIMLLPISEEASDSLRKILSRMKVDEISDCVKSDQTIIKYGNALSRKHRNNDDQTHHISNKLRELARLFIELRSGSIMSVADIFNPVNFPVVISSVMKMCEWDEETNTVRAPSLGIKLGHLLSKVSFLLQGQAMINGNELMEKDVKKFHKLVAMRWNDEIARVSFIELERRKWNRPNLLPFTKDLQMLKKHLNQVQAESSQMLSANRKDLRAWRNLATSTLASIIMFNRRREGEVSKLSVSVFEKCSFHAPQDDITASLTNFELELCKSLKRVEIRGKRGRKVPLILTGNNEKAITLLLECRAEVGVSEKNEFVFSVPTMDSEHYIRGNDALRKHVQEIKGDLKQPDAITSTKLRKHIATITQLLNLEERELEMLANFLGHDIQVHREFYRLPDDTLQLAKCGKLLVMMDQGKTAENVGKSLSEIEVGENEEVLEDGDGVTDDEDSGDADNTENTENTASNEKEKVILATRKCNRPTTGKENRPSDKRGKRKRKKSLSHSSDEGEIMPEPRPVPPRQNKGRVAWTDTEKAAVTKYLSKYLDTITTPGKRDCEECLKKAGDALQRRTWKDVKFFVYNSNNSRKPKKST